MAIAFDNASTAGGSAVNSVQWTHTAAGTNTYMIYAACCNDTPSISTVAYNNVAFTKKLYLADAGDGGFGHCWSLIGNNTGSLTMSAVLVGASTIAFSMGVCSYKNVAQTAPEGTISNTSGLATGTLTLSISSTANQVIACFVFSSIIGSINYVPDAAQTQRFYRSDDFNVIQAFDSVAVGATTNLSFSFVVEASMAAFAIGISGTAAAAGGVLYTMALLGVGA